MRMCSVFSVGSSVPSKTIRAKCLLSATPTGMEIPESVEFVWPFEIQDGGTGKLVILVEEIEFHNCACLVHRKLTSRARKILVLQILERDWSGVFTIWRQLFSRIISSVSVSVILTV